jgi:hypothetical protein
MKQKKIGRCVWIVWNVHLKEPKSLDVLLLKRGYAFLVANEKYHRIICASSVCQPKSLHIKGDSKDMPKKTGVVSAEEIRVRFWLGIILGVQGVNSYTSLVLLAPKKRPKA